MNRRLLLYIITVVLSTENGTAELIKHLLDTDNPIFFNPNDQVNIEFGFSLSLFVNETHRSLLVGAPLANTSQQGVLNPGALYSCDLNNLNDIVYCSQLNVDVKDADEKYSPFVTEDLKDFQRLGASVSSKYKEVLVCAPNWHYYEMRINSPIDTPVGTCFRSTSLESFEQFSVPYDIYGDQSIDYLRTGSCQSGFSTTLSQDNTLVLGSPGCYNWQGDVFAGYDSSWIQFGKNFSSEDLGGVETTKLWLSNAYVGYSVAAGTFNGIQGIVAGSPRSTSTPSTVTQSNGNTLSIVSPMVTIFIQNKNWLKLWTTLLPPLNSTGQIDAVWLFSYFGYAVAVADVDGNGLDDVIVGAPFYHNETQKDQGAILVYMQQAEHIPGISMRYTISMEQNKKLRVGLSDYERFGSCVSSIGDIDGDGIQDVAVGAPYATDGGHVFIYLGSRDGLPEEPSHIISASDSYLAWKKLNGFGSSIASGFMVEDGLQTDLAIGAASSDVTVVLISKVPIAVDWSVKFPEKMDLKSKCYLKNSVEPCTEMVTCLSYRFFEKGKHDETRPKEFILKYQLDVNASPRRLFFDNEKTTRSKNIFIEYEKPVCFTDKVYTSKQIENFDPFEIIAEIAHVPRLKNDKSSLHYSQEVTQTEHLDIMIECNANDISKCECDITLRSKVYPTALDVSDVKLNLFYEITNSGEPAYSLKLHLKTDDDLVTSGKPILDESSTVHPIIDCRKIGKGLFVCYLGNFVNDEDMLRFSLYLTTTETFLNISNLRHQDAAFNITSHLTSLSRIRDSAVAKTRMVATITANPQVSLTKEKSSTLVSYNDSSTFLYPEESKKDLERVGPVVKHVYKVYNQMNYAIENNSFILYWPLKIKDRFLLYLSSFPQIPGIVNISKSCKKKSQKGAVLVAMETLPLIDDITWTIITCSAITLEPGQITNINLSARLVLKTIREEVDSLAFDEINSFMTVTSNPILLNKEYQLSYNNNIKTEIDYGDYSLSKVAWWMIVVAVILAIIILAFIIYVLCKCNFFKRKKVDQSSQAHTAGDQHEVEEEEEALHEAEPFKVIQAEEYDNM